MTIRAVVFDLDDTLVDHTGAARSGFRSWLPQLGPVSVPAHEAEELWFALEERYYQRYLAGELSFAGKRRARLEEFQRALGVRTEDTHSPSGDLFADYVAAYTRAWRPYDDAVPTLQRLRAAGLVVAVLTNGDQTQQEAKLRATGLLGLCGPVYASSSLGAAKPQAAAYAAVQAALEVPAGSLLMVGDNVVNDVSGARAAGWSAVHLDRSGGTSSSIRSLADLGW